MHTNLTDKIESIPRNLIKNIRRIVFHEESDSKKNGEIINSGLSMTLLPPSRKYYC